MAKFGGSLNLFPVLSFFSVKRVFTFVSLGNTVSRSRPRFAYILGDDGNARSQGGRQPAAAKPPLYMYSFLPVGRYFLGKIY